MAGNDGSDGKTKPTGVCIHLGVRGVRDANGKHTITGAAITGIHAAAPPAAPGASCSPRASSGAATDAYRVGWDRVFAQAAAADEAPAPPASAPAPTIGFLDLSRQTIGAIPGRN